MRYLIAPAALIVGLVLSSAGAAAAAPDSSISAAVVSPPAVQMKELGRTTDIGAPIEDVTVSRPVSYAGLNLSNPADHAAGVLARRKRERQGDVDPARPGALRRHAVQPTYKRT